MKSERRTVKKRTLLASLRKTPKLLAEFDYSRSFPIATQPIVRLCSQFPVFRRFYSFIFSPKNNDKKEEQSELFTAGMKPLLTTRVRLLVLIESCCAPFRKPLIAVCPWWYYGADECHQLSKNKTLRQSNCPGNAGRLLGSMTMGADVAAKHAKETHEMR